MGRTNGKTLEDFARRVERLCDFLIAKSREETGRNGSNDQKAIEDLKEEAADFQNVVEVETDDDDVDGIEIVDEDKVDMIAGLSDYMSGHPLPDIKE